MGLLDPNPTVSFGHSSHGHSLLPTLHTRFLVLVCHSQTYGATLPNSLSPPGSDLTPFKFNGQRNYGSESVSWLLRGAPEQGYLYVAPWPSITSETSWRPAACFYQLCASSMGAMISRAGQCRKVRTHTSTKLGVCDDRALTLTPWS